MDAASEMKLWLGRLAGHGWRKRCRHWYDDFETNVRAGLHLGSKQIASLSIIVSTFNSIGTLPLAMESYAGQTVLPLEVIVADDGSSDGTTEWLDGLEEGTYPFPVRYVTRKHLGYALVGVNNEAARHATGKRLLFTNADQVHCPDSVKAHAALEENVIGGGLFTGIAIDGVSQVTVDAVRDFCRIRLLSGGFPPTMTNAEYLKGPPSQNMFGCWGGNYSVSASKLLEAGRFNEEYVGKYGAEEADFILRARRVGCKLKWVPDSEAYHLEHHPRAYKRWALGNKKLRAELRIGK